MNKILDEMLIQTLVELNDFVGRRFHKFRVPYGECKDDAMSDLMVEG